MKILVTGAAGFIGFHLVKALIELGYEVIGYDNINDYYAVSLKNDRLKESGINIESVMDFEICQSTKYNNYSFVKASLEDKDFLFALFKNEKFDVVVNLAAQAGVRYSLENPSVYIQSNIVGFINVLEACRHNPVKHLVYASSSSVYGSNTKMPFNVNDGANHPVSLYAATKRANELMAHTYSHLYNLPTTGLRFFTVYGPWGRPDMAPMLFTDAITKGEKIKVFNNGEMQRDFTFVGDIVDGVIKVMNSPAITNSAWNSDKPDLSSSIAPYKIYNIGNSKPVRLMEFISEIEKSLGVEAVKEFMPLQSGDVVATWADVEDLKMELGYNPQTNISEGVGEFVTWYRKYYESNN